MNVLLTEILNKINQSSSFEGLFYKRNCIEQQQSMKLTNRFAMCKFEK